MFTGKFESAGEEATNMWYEEVKKYDFKKSGFKSGTGHFTQVVWKGSKKLGMARARTPDERETYVVARYDPAGNMLGDFDKNVFPAKQGRGRFDHALQAAFNYWNLGLVEYVGWFL